MATTNKAANQPSEWTGERAGWIAALALWTFCFVWVAVIKGLGIMLPTLQDQFATKTWIIGWITSMITAALGLTGTWAGFLGRRFGPGAVIMACGAMLGAASIAGSFTATAMQFALIYVPLTGTGLGVSVVLAKEAIGRSFDKSHATATGVARTGASVGFLVLPPLVQLLLNTYGWRGTMLLIAGISSHLTVCGALLHTARLPPVEYQEIPSSAQPHQTSLRSCCSGLWNSFIESKDLRLLLSFRYWTAAAVSCNSKFAFDMWSIYFVSAVQSKGFSLEAAATFVTVGGLGSVISKIAQGFVVDRGIMSCWGLIAIVLSINSALYCVTPWLNSYWMLMVYSFLILSTDGMVSCLSDVLTKQLLGVELLAGAYGWMGLKAALLRFTLGFLPGLIYDNTGNFNAAFVFIGLIQASSLIFLVITRYHRYVE